MRTLIRYAVLSFCSELTNPRGTSVPVAVVGTGSLADRDNFWFFVSKSRPGDEVGKGDPFSTEILNNLPSLLKQQLGEGSGSVPADRFLSWIHDRFRNSLHVSSLSAPQEKELGSFKEVVAELGAIYEAAVYPGAPEQPFEIPSVEVRRFEPALCG